MTDPTGRFTDRVETYARARPGYPTQVVGVLRERAGLRPGAVVGHPDHEPMLAELGALFDAHAQDGAVRFAYRTDLYLGRFG